MAFADSKYSVSNFNLANGGVPVCSQKALAVDDTEVKTSVIKLTEWDRKAYNLKIYVLNVGSTNPLTFCKVYGGFAGSTGQGEAITAKTFDITNFFNKSADPAALAAGESAMLVYNQDGLPESVQVGVKGGSGAATDVLVIFEVALRPEARR